MQTSTATINVVNGVDVPALFQTIEAVKTDPTVASFNFRIRNQWVDGGYNRSQVTDFHGANQDLRHAAPFTLEADEPAILLGADRGANPVEHLLHALAACVTTSMVYHAAARGIAIEEVESTVEGDIDLRGLLNISEDVRNGYQGIRMNFRIKADVSDDELQELCQLGPRFSPVFDSITAGVPVAVTAARK